MSLVAIDRSAIQLAGRRQNVRPTIFVVVHAKARSERKATNLPRN